MLGASGAVLVLDKASPALEHVDSSSGPIGTAVNHAIDTCAKVIAPRHRSTMRREIDARPTL